MAATLDKDRNEDPHKRALRKEILTNCLADFASKNTRHFFLKMKINQKFLNEDPGS